MSETDKHLIAHVGQGKTGTSAIQTALALGVEALKTHGIVYPDNRSLDQARAGRISSGNVNGVSFFETCSTELEACDPGETVLVSNESLHRVFFEDVSPLKRILAHADSVKLIYYIRDPLSQALSAYGQSVKRGGSMASVSEYLLSDINLKISIEFLELLDALPVQVEIVNYSRHEDRHIARFCQALGLADNALSLPEGRRVNRSLTRSELYFQQKLSSHAKNPKAANISDALCNELPDIPSEIPYFSAETHRAFIEAQLPWVEKLNSMIPAEEALALPQYDDIAPNLAPKDETVLEFSTAQIDVLARTLMQRIPSQIVNKDVRELASRIRPGHQLTETDAVILLDMAAAFLPNAEGVRRKRDRLRGKIAGRTKGKAPARNK